MNYDNRPVSAIKGIGHVRSVQLARLGVFTIQNLLEHYPVRYENRGSITPVAFLTDNQLGTIQATILQVTERKTLLSGNRSRPLLITTATVRDESGTAELVWFNQPHQKNRLQSGMKIIASGMAEKRFGKIQIKKVEWEEVSLNNTVGGISPVYSSTENLSQLFLRDTIRYVLTALPANDDPLPPAIKARYNLLGRLESLRGIHQPENEQELKQSRTRLAFEELYYMQCALLYCKQQQKSVLSGIKHNSDGELTKKTLAALPYQLTADQQMALNEIKQDMEDPRPMRRLLQGDVGSGKTILAILALIKTVENGYQGAMMAPTEILAEQHFRTIQELLDPMEIRSALLTGSLGAKARAEVLFNLKAGQIDIVIGTHALIQENVHFAHLGLVITDEQHRFGVEQRTLLEEKGKSPDVLVMTATPIPRTMALTVYGDLDVSTIKELPPGRKPIKTYHITSELRHRVYSNLVLKEISLGRQVYVVCPLIEESEDSDIQSVITLFDELKSRYMRDIPCALFHGRMNSAQKETIMGDFCAGKIKLLVATTVIEVGVNVPNATAMVVEDAHRFGLAQLHQLRGRIGRGEYQSYCILISDSKSEDSQYRLRSMTETQDGFVLAERDLVLRGPGQFFGLRQHGMPELKLADMINDLPLLLQAREAAAQTVMDSELIEQVKPSLDYYFGPWMAGFKG